MSTIQIWRFAAIAIAASILDGATTYAAVHGALGTELNPIAAHGMHVLGVGPLIVVDLAIRLVLVVALVWIVRSAVQPVARTAATTLFIGVATLWTLIVVSNASTIAMAVA